MRTRHLFAEKARNPPCPREISREQVNILQMNNCSDMILARLAAIPLFAGLSEDERRELCTELGACVKRYAHGEMVAHECSPASTIYVVWSGRVAVRECVLREDARHLVCFLHPGEAYGTLFPALDLKNNPDMVTAEEPSELLLLRVDRIREWIRKGTHPKFVANLYAAAARQGAKAWRKLKLLGCYEIADRLKLYRQWRKEDGHADEKLPLMSELAEYLGVNRTALHRVLNKESCE